MAIVQEQYTCNNGKVLTKTYSDKNYYIKQVETGELYTEAYDEPNTYTYKETRKKIEAGGVDAETQDNISES